MKDKSTENMAEKHEWLEPLTEWRILQLKVYGNYNMTRKAWKERNEKIKLVTKSGYGRKGARMKDGQGTLTVPARKYLLNQLLETEEMVNRIRKLYKLEPTELITKEELDLIYWHWDNDKENNPHIYDNQVGLEFDSILHLVEED
jgi:hypothetical protein